MERIRECAANVARELAIEPTGGVIGIIAQGIRVYHERAAAAPAALPGKLSEAERDALMMALTQRDVRDYEKVQRIIADHVAQAQRAALEVASRHNLRFTDGAVAGCAECDWRIGSGTSWAAHIRALELAAAEPLA